MISNIYLSKSLILQTLQQLRDVYGDSVDRVISGNIENIVFLKSTDDAMIDTLVKMSGTKHVSRIDQKTITKDNERLMNQNEGRISYTMATTEQPVIGFNDFLFIKERNSIVIKAGSSPLWNRNQTALPMSFRLFKDTIKLPGKKFTLQTVPTNSSAIDFDVRKNQPNFFDMLDQRIAQARQSDVMRSQYMDAYGFTEATIIQEDQNVVADDIMDAINRSLSISENRDPSEGMSEEEMNAVADEYAGYGESSLDKAEDNTEMMEKAAQAQALQDDQNKMRYANGHICRDYLMSVSGQVNRQLESVLAEGYSASIQHFDGGDYRVTKEQELESSTGTLFVKSSIGANRHDVESLTNAESDENTRVYGEGENSGVFFEVTDAFIRHLVELESWKDIARGRFENEVARAYQKDKML